MLLIGFQFMSPSWCDAFALIIMFSRRHRHRVVFSFYCSYCSLSEFSILFHFFFLAVICFSLSLSLYALLTNIGHPLRIWPITPQYTRITNYFHQKRAQTNERTKEKKSPIEENELYCNTFTHGRASNIRHVSCCFVF